MFGPIDKIGLIHHRRARSVTPTHTQLVRCAHVYRMVTCPVGLVVSPSFLRPYTTPPMSQRSTSSPPPTGCAGKK
ncbi:unnamed protein product [Protopolystoma xenopodis]|uniref:Uncharacterized protein n=1 Tax=Protopolystoma xenopodis TaxID=117903 RepID=A0A3S5AT32_9PLAT|nr:unnamed protein product [Protopolystoma xenopodis]